MPCLPRHPRSQVCRRNVTHGTHVYTRLHALHTLHRSADATALEGILNTSMTFVVELVLRKYHAAEQLKVSREALRSMLLSIEAGYLPNPYHNATHGADVAYTFHALLVNGAGESPPHVPEGGGWKALHTVTYRYA